jgi:hypothetical protein
MGVRIRGTKEKTKIQQTDEQEFQYISTEIKARGLTILPRKPFGQIRRSLKLEDIVIYNIHAAATQTGSAWCAM